MSHYPTFSSHGTKLSWVGWSAVLIFYLGFPLPGPGLLPQAARFPYCQTDNFSFEIKLKFLGRNFILKNLFWTWWKSDQDFISREKPSAKYDVVTLYSELIFQLEIQHCVKMPRIQLVATFLAISHPEASLAYPGQSDFDLLQSVTPSDISQTVTHFSAPARSSATSFHWYEMNKEKLSVRGRVKIV